MNIELALNLARHAHEASILAGNEVCQRIMQDCATTIRQLVAEQMMTTKLSQRAEQLEKRLDDQDRRIADAIKKLDQLLNPDAE